MPSWAPVLDRLKGSTKHELPQKESPSCSHACKRRSSSRYWGIKRDSSGKWAAQINCGGVKTYLRSYDKELTAAIIFQILDGESLDRIYMA